MLSMKNDNHEMKRKKTKRRKAVIDRKTIPASASLALPAWYGHPAASPPASISQLVERASKETRRGIKNVKKILSKIT